MVAAVETMFYTKSTPWHGLGTKLDQESPTVAEAINAAGLNWRVGLKDLFTQDQEPVNARATYRETDNVILGVVGPRYVPLQNDTAFNWFQPFLDSGECSLHTAGALHEGQKVWVLAELNRNNSTIVTGDEVAKFILLSNSHDGTTAIRVGYTPIRVVCANTMAMAHSCKQSKLLRVRHTKSSKTNLDNVREIMNNINGEFESTAEQFRFLASKQFNQADIRKYVKTMLNIDKNVLDVDIKTRTRNIMDEIMGLIEGPKQNIDGVRGTYWAAYNGYNEYLNYNKGRSASNRLDSLWFGTGANDNRNALETAMEFATSV